MNIIVNKINIGYRSDARRIGRSEDGEDIYGEVIYVLAELPDGRRFAHFHGFADSEMAEAYDDEYGLVIYVKRDYEAADKAAALAEKIKAAGELDMDHWSEIEPVYGSGAFAAWEAEQIAAYGIDYLGA